MRRAAALGLSAAEREGQRLTLLLVNGNKVPVSRTYLASLKQAGWLES